MWWTKRTLDRTRLCRAATRYANHGWDVIPGASFVGHRFRCDDPGCPTVGCHPATGQWQELASHDLPLVERWWRHRAYAVLLPTGRAFDVIEVPPALGMWATRHGGGQQGPVAVASSGRWMFFVRRGDPLRPELAEQLDVVLHGRGSWVPAPPTREPGGRGRWEISPEAAGWLLPRSYTVQNLLVAALTVTAPEILLRAPWQVGSAAAHAA